MAAQYVDVFRRHYNLKPDEGRRELVRVGDAATWYDADAGYQTRRVVERRGLLLVMELYPWETSFDQAVVEVRQLTTVQRPVELLRDPLPIERRLPARGMSEARLVREVPIQATEVGQGSAAPVAQHGASQQGNVSLGKRTAAAKGLPPVGTVITRPKSTATCTITAEGVLYAGRTYATLTAAAAAAAVDLGMSPLVNGWRWWGVEKPA